MPSFIGGVESGKGVSNPFGIILREYGKAEQRRLDEDKQRRSEERELKKSLEILAMKHEYDKELEGIKQTGSADQVQKFLSQFGMGGNVPPDTNISIKGPGGTNITMPVNRKFTGEEVKSLSTADQLVSEIGDLKSLIQSNKGKSAQLFGALPFGFGTEQGQSFALLKDSIGERLLRLRSGAQINEKEYQRFRKLLPSLFRKDKLDIEQLERFENEFNSIKGRILSGAKFDEKSKEFVVPKGGSAGTQGNVIIMQDAKGNKAKVRIDSNGKPVEVLENL